MSHVVPHGFVAIGGDTIRLTNNEPLLAIAYKEDLSAGTLRLPVRFGTAPTAQEIALEENGGDNYFDVTAPMHLKRIGWGTPVGVTLGAAATAIDPPDDAGAVELTGDAGGNTISTITSTGFEEGDRLKLTVVALGGGITLTDTASPGADQLALNGGAAFTVDSVMELEFTGSYWREAYRSLN